jgi:hypothetical protein
MTLETDCITSGHFVPLLQRHWLDAMTLESVKAIPFSQEPQHCRSLDAMVVMQSTSANHAPTSSAAV